MLVFARQSSMGTASAGSARRMPRSVGLIRVQSPVDILCDGIGAEGFADGVFDVGHARVVAIGARTKPVQAAGETAHRWSGLCCPRSFAGKAQTLPAGAGRVG